MAKPPKKPKKPVLRLLKGPKNTVSREEFDRARRMKAIESPPNPELLAAQQRAIAAMTKKERAIFDGVVHQIKSLTKDTPTLVVGQLMQESMHWALPPLVKVYLAREFSQRIQSIGW